LGRTTLKQKEDIRKSILEKSRELFLKYGFEKTSTRMIAGEVGIANGTLFNYFSSKGEIFIEILSAGYIKKDEITSKINLDNKKPSDVVFDFCANNMEIFIQMPKDILKETVTVVVSTINKKNNLLSKIIDLDIGFMAELNGVITILIDKGMIRKCNSKLLSETIYSSILYDYFLFIFDYEIKKNEFLSMMKEKITFLVEPYEVK
jgi:AcrR family transcriptional regulator